MAQTKNTKPKKQQPTAVAVDDDGFACLGEAMLLRWRAHDAEVRAHAAELALLGNQIDAEFQKAPVLLRMIGQRGSLSAELKASQATLDEVLQEIAAATGIEPKDLVIDDKTGRLHTLKQDGNIDPVTAPPADRRKARA